MKWQAFVQKLGKDVAKRKCNDFRDAIKEVISVQAPRQRTPSWPYWRAKTLATPGAPPRRVSGELKKSVKVKRTIRGYSLVMYRYGLWLEEQNHPFIDLALKKIGLLKSKLGRVMAAVFGTKKGKKKVAKAGRVAKGRVTKKRSP